MTCPRAWGNHNQRQMQDSHNAKFNSTQWTLLSKAIRGEADESRLAMAKLCELYWPPLYVFVRRKGLNPSDAEDAVQGFFAKLIEHDWLERANEAKGKLRTFFLTLLDRHITGEWRKDHAAKRGGKAITISIDQGHEEKWFGTEPVESMTPESLFERRWALALLEGTVTELENHYRLKQQEDRFAALKPYLGWQAGEDTYLQVAQALGISEGAVKVAVHRFRQKYREVLTRQVSETLDTRDPAAVKEELQHLFTVLA